MNINYISKISPPRSGAGQLVLVNIGQQIRQIKVVRPLLANVLISWGDDYFKPMNIELFANIGIFHGFICILKF